MKMNVEDLVYQEDVYPRDSINHEKVREYSEILSVLPPIVVNQNKVILDGVHRWMAHRTMKQKEIEVSIIETKDDDDVLLKSAELNAKHGFQLTNKEKKKIIVKLYEKLLKTDKVSYDVNRLKTAYSIPESTFSDWTKDINDELEAQRLERILDLHLQCKEPKQIGELVGLKERTVYAKIEEISHILKDFAENPNSEFIQKYAEMYKKWKIIAEFTPLLYNVWNVNRNNNSQKHFGNFPIEFMENLLYYYTKPFDVVYDPFAGGGVMIDACKKWFRKYYVSDLNPIPSRENEILKWDINTGLPKDMSTPQFVFLDPPYWKQAHEKYSDSPNDLANMTLDGFYESMNKLIKEIKKTLKEGAVVAFIISATQDKEEAYKTEDHAFKIYQMFEDAKFTFVQRIICPYSSEQYNGNQVIMFKEKKVMLNLFRDLLIFKKGE